MALNRKGPRPRSPSGRAAPKRAGKPPSKAPPRAKEPRLPKRLSPASAGLLTEDSLQFTKAGGDAVLALVIGLDFGTSSTKVVIRAPYLQDGQHWAINFGALAHHSMAYLVPTLLCVSKGGECSLQRRGDPTPQVLVRDIKLSLFDDPLCRAGAFSPKNLGLDGEEVAAVYLALVLRYAREWLLATNSLLMSAHSRIDWSLNLGVPSPSIDDNAENRRFRRVGRAAWLLSTLEGPLKLTHASRELSDIDANPEYWIGDPPASGCRFAIIPEICASAVGYANSRGRRNGLHVMLDFGASTVDACSFILRTNEDKEDAYSLLTADVQQFGTVKIHQERARAVLDACRDHTGELVKVHDPLDPLTNELGGYAPPDGKITGGVAQYERNLAEHCGYILIGMVHDLVVRRAPKQVELKTGLPVMLTGGGCNHPIYKAALKHAEVEVDKFGVERGFRVMELPMPAGIGSTPDEKSRLAVAWGLSHPEHKIGEVTPMSEIPDVDRRPPPPPLDDGYVGPEQV